MKKMRYMLLAILALILLCVPGCDNKQNNAGDVSSKSAITAEKGSSPQTVTPEAEKTQTNGKLTINVYYPDEQGMKLVAVKKTVKLGNDDKYTAALKALMSGTKEKGLATIVPKQAKIKSVKVKDDTAYVDFDENLVKKFIGGSTGEEMLVGSLVNTLTEFSEIKKIQILVEGKKIDSLAGHFDLTKPVERMTNLIKK